MKASVIVLAILALAGIMGITMAQAGQTKAKLGGINAKDAFPNGCVSCHVKLPDQDVRLSVGLAKIKKHPSIASVKNVPSDCMKCHKAGTARAMSIPVHKMHYQNPDKSVFIAKFEGACLNCHKLDAKTFKMTVKSGAKNW